MPATPSTPTSCEGAAGNSRRLITVEIWIVLGLSLGQSAVYAVVTLIDKLTRGSLRDADAAMNISRSEREWLDLIYQLLGIGFALIPAALAIYLLWSDNPQLVRRLGLTDSRPLRALGQGAALAAVIGIPGIGVYLIGRAMGITAQIDTVPERVYWWTAAVLILAAIQNAVLENVVMVGYLYTRLEQLGWGRWQVVLSSAAIRGTYHLYQGVGQGIGNLAMGVIFGWWYLRTRKLIVLIIAHALLDIVAFLGMLALGNRLGLR